MDKDNTTTTQYRNDTVTISLAAAHKINRWMIEHVVAGNPTDPGYEGHTELTEALRATLRTKDNDYESIQRKS